MDYEEAENNGLDEQVERMVKEGLLNPEPVFNIIAQAKIFGYAEDLEQPAYAREVAQRYI